MSSRKGQKYTGRAGPLEIKIEKNIPLPAADKIRGRGRHSGRRLINFDIFGVGDSALVPAEKYKVIFNSLRTYLKKHPNKDFVFLHDGSRIWRSK